MNIKTVEDLFIHLLSDTYSAEKQLTKALPKLARATSNEKLSQAFQSHLEETQGQIERIDQIVESESGIKLKRMKCVAMEGLIEEANEVIESTEKNEVRDAALIAAAQKVEHYEIASYGTLATLAEQLGYSKALKLLKETLDEEKQTDLKLTDLAVSNVNRSRLSRIEECKMNYTEHYHDWLRDAHAMEKQAESMLESMASRIENYPDIKARIEQHISETKHQITMLEEVLDRNGISRSVLKDSMSKMAAMGQSIGGMFPSDEIVKGSISGYVFEQFEIACYTSLLAAAKKAGDTASIPTIEAILKEEMQMADWLIKHIPQTTEQFLLRSEADGVEAKK